MTKLQFAIIAALGTIVLIFMLVFAGVIPGLQNKNNPTNISAEITLWTYGENAGALSSAIAAFNEIYKNTTITSRNFEDAEKYERAVIDALAAGAGPDIFMVKNSKLPLMANKLTPVPPEKFSLLRLRNLFPKVVEQDFAPQGKIYALPLSIDTLALIYNREFLDQNGVTVPKTWKEFEDAVKKLTEYGAGKRILRAGAAIGGSKKSIPNAADILSLLMLQSGTEMVTYEGQSARASFNTPEGKEALEFYIQFANAQNETYTWNDTFPDAAEAMNRGEVAMIFDYAENIARIREQNPFFDIAIAPVPQPEKAVIKIAYPSYWGFAVSRQSRVPNLAWDFIITITTDERIAYEYAANSGKPPAMRRVIGWYAEDPNLSVFARQALIARSWPQADADAISDIFSRMIELAVGNPAAVESALTQAEIEVTNLMRNDF